MLAQLDISNLLLIKDATIKFSPGLTVITGETGAGKSLLIDAIKLLTGAKSRPKLVRPGCDFANITATFINLPELICQELAALDITVQEELIIRRRLSADGKSRLFLNDTPVSLATITKFASKLIQIHQQHASQQILEQEFLRYFIDAQLAKPQLLAEVAVSYRQWQQVTRELLELKPQLQLHLQQQEFLQNINQELQQLNLQADEEVTLVARRSELLKLQKQQQIIAELDELLNAETSLSNLSHKFQLKLVKLSEFALEIPLAELEQKLNQVDQLVTEIATIIQPHCGYDRDLNYELDEIEDRLAAIRLAERRFAKPAALLYDYAQELTQQLADFTIIEAKITELEQQEIKLKELYLEQAIQLQQQRRLAVTLILPKLQDELALLKLQQVNIAINVVEQPEGNWQAHGIDYLELLISTNPGMPLTKISDSASGGELSRFTLAWLVLASEFFILPTIIFDEIDIGVGGAVASSIGSRMQKLSEQRQVITISHQPQLAALAKQQLHVAKFQAAETTQVVIKQLSRPERLAELARMLAGDEITDAAMLAAEALMSETTDEYA